MQENKILVLGATGKTGRKVVQKLEALGKSVRQGSRSAHPSFDWENSDNWDKVLNGIHSAYITFYPDLAVPGAFEAVSKFTAAAKQAGVKKLVLLSGKGEKEAERCEQIVANAGLDYTLVRASWFSQNFSESFLLDPILAGHVALPMPEAKIPFVDTDDIADVVVEALLNEQHNGKTYEVTGPKALTFEEVVKIIATASNKTIQYQAVSLETYNEMMKSVGVPEDYIWLFDYLFREVLSKAENQYISNDVEKVLGRKATSFTEYASKTAQSGIWNQSLAASI